MQATCSTAKCSKPHHARKLCKTHYTAWHRKQKQCKSPGCKNMQVAHYRCRPHEREALTLRKSKRKQQEWLDKFLANIDADLETGCWMWTGPTNPDGYGLHQADGTWLAHRYSFVWFHRGHARNRVLDHLCNRALCVRPDHLQPITNTENSRLRYSRELIADKNFFLAANGSPVYPRAVKWAQENGLPWEKPELLAVPRMLTSLRPA